LQLWYVALTLNNQISREKICRIFKMQPAK